MMGMVLSRFCYQKFFFFKHIIIDGRGFFAANVGIEASNIIKDGVQLGGYLVYPSKMRFFVKGTVIWETNHRQMRRMITPI